MKKHRKRNVFILCGLILALLAVAYLVQDNGEHYNDFVQGFEAGLESK